MSNKAIKYRLYPTTEQSIMFAKTFGCCRKVYNLMLADKIEYYKTNGTMLATTPAQYKKEYPYLKEVDSLALANVQINLQRAYTNFFRDKKVGFPKFKSSKHSRKSYTTNNQNGTIGINDKSIKLPKIGFVKAKIHRLPDTDWIIKSATISQDSDGKFYASVLYEYDSIVKQLPASNNAIGLDYKSDGLYMDSNNNSADMPKYYKSACNRLAKAGRQLSRKVGNRKNESKSNNYIKQLRKVSKIHKHISNQRKDFLHKLSTEIANQYDIVCIEDLNMIDVLHSLPYENYHKSTLDNGFGMFVDMLRYKLADRGKYLIKVDKSYPSSEVCSNCGRRHTMSLTNRHYVCECGLSLDRDYNAAINIKNEGLRILELAS